MNSVLMQGMSPVASMPGSPAAATGDFLAVLADALAPSASPEVVGAVEAGPELADTSTPGTTMPTPSVPVTPSASVTVPSADVVRCAAIAYAATDAAADPAVGGATALPGSETPLDPSTSTTVAAPVDLPTAVATIASSSAVPSAPAGVRRSDDPTGVTDDAPFASGADDRRWVTDAAAVRVVDPTGRMPSAAASVDDVRDDSAPTDDRKDLASRQPAGVDVVRPTVDVTSPPLPQWNGRGPAEVAAAVRPAHGHSSSSRPTVHSAHGPVARPGWLPEAIGAQALAVRGDAALQAVGQYAAVGRNPGAHHVLPMTELRATAGVVTAPIAAGALDRPGLAVGLVALDGEADDADRPAAGTSHGGHAAAVGDAANLERTPPPVDVTSATTSNVPTGGAAVVRPAPAGPVGAALHRTPHPGGLGMIGTDRVDRVRQQTAGRPVQRLTVDLDDARVAVRVRGERVSVDVLSDPSSTLGQTWAHDVERTLETAMRAQETSPGRLPVERERVSTTHTAGSDHRNDAHRGSGSDHRGGEQSGREQRREVPWWLTEDDE